MAGVEELSREELVSLLVAQAGTIAAQKETIASQAEMVEELRRRVAELERRAAGAEKGKRGKRKGADGSSLAWSDDPDETVPHYPLGACGCGADLGGAAEVGLARSHQVHEVPLVTVKVVQHDLYRVRCGCGREHVAGQPGGVARAPASYGPNLLALVVYLLVFQHVPVERAALLVRDVTGAAPSTGFVHGVLARAAVAVAVAGTGTVERIKELVVGSPVVGFDETTLRCGPAGKKKYVLSASTDLYVVFGLGGRDLAGFKAFGVLGDFAGTAVHDRYNLYDHADFAQVGGHQLCVAHILRDLEDVAEVYPDSRWPGQAQRALRGLVRAWHTARDAGRARVPVEAAGPLTAEFRGAVRVGLSEVPPPTARPPRPSSRPAAACWNACGTGKTTSCGSARTPESGRRTTSVTATCGPRKPSRRSPAG
ncbi:IS66 family transposase [Frankia sp. Cr1]|uniref:IS66 family transposase n=1 Tax=Frankia sp. Cr1 TaxID=3073931 RepID=UPI002AD4E7AE|nr:transposase [Frankia sp. Cr1]